jgi:maltooligosyltrehalose trehalohydrolase
MAILNSAAGALGASNRGEVTDFCLWAPRLSQRLSQPRLRLLRRGHPAEEHAMHPLGEGYWGATLTAGAGDRYQYLAGEMALPDPASRLLPEGVHGPTEIVDPAFAWKATNWRGLPLAEYVIYELHVGCFTPEGTLDAAIGRLDYLRELGVTAIELMPLNAVPGERNWGYDGVGLYAVQRNYGGPQALCRFVDAAHQRGLAVLLDVVYNHLGNEGNYLSQFGPYFTPHHKNLWGDAINYDDEGSVHVRRFIVENALYWLESYRLDGLRLDAVQTIRDDSPQHIVAEIAERAHQFARSEQREIEIIAETDENDPRYVLPAPAGYGADAMWSDDFHHAIHVLLTGESNGYYGDFRSPALVPRVISEPYAYQGEPFQFWHGKPRGAPPGKLPLPTQVICIQNHDQAGNRAYGERLSALAPAGASKFAAALSLLAPHTPLLFMGEEYGERAPFQFFTSFGDPVIQRAVSEGRRREFANFGWRDIPEPQAPETFLRSRLRWPQRAENIEMLGWYRSLLRLRREFVLKQPRTARAEWLAEKLLLVESPAEAPQLRIVAALEGSPLPADEPGWRVKLESEQDGYRLRVLTLY